MTTAAARPDYGIDAPSVMRNLFLAGAACLVLGLFGPMHLPIAGVDFQIRWSFLWPAASFLLGGVLYLVYVKFGKFRHRDFMLDLRRWTGAERVLDVGCGRGLLLAGAAKRIAAVGGNGHVTGIDIWSNVDMGGNSESATQANLALEGIVDCCTLIGEAAQDMTFADGSFEVVVSNLCLHNIGDRATRERALAQIARVLAPGGSALISDFRNIGEYARVFRALGLDVESRRGSFVTTFPPLTVVIARKPTYGADA
jgi:SAM-dependent methyltransferase